MIICNLVDEDYLKGMDRNGSAIHHLMSYLLDIKNKYNPKNIVGIHMIGFDGAVKPYIMKKLVTE